MDFDSASMIVEEAGLRRLSPAYRQPKLAYGLPPARSSAYNRDPNERGGKDAHAMDDRPHGQLPRAASKPELGETRAASIAATAAGVQTAESSPAGERIGEQIGPY